MSQHQGFGQAPRQGPSGPPPPSQPPQPQPQSQPAQPPPAIEPGKASPKPGKAAPKSDKTVPKQKKPLTLKQALRVTTVVSLVLWTIAVAGAGFAGGWLTQERIQAQRTTEGPTVVEIPALVETNAESMPDVRGLSLADAKQALADIQINAGAVDVTTVEWAGEPGVVIAQDPVVGETVKDAIALRVSSEVTMPDVVGLPKGEAIDKLRALGVEPEIVDKYELTSPTGTVLVAEPGVGKPLLSTVTLTVAQPGSSVFFSRLAAVDAPCSVKAADVNAVRYSNSVSCRTGDVDYTQVGVWLLNRRAALITGMVGVDDKGATTAAATVTVTGDGKPLATLDVSYAKPAELSVDVTGILRLEIDFRSTDGSEVVLAELLVKGASADIDTLETES